MFFFEKDKQMLLRTLEAQNQSIRDLEKTCRTLLDICQLLRKRIEHLEGKQ